VINSNLGPISHCLATIHPWQTTIDRQTERQTDDNRTKSSTVTQVWSAKKWPVAYRFRDEGPQGSQDDADLHFLSPQLHTSLHCKTMDSELVHRVTVVQFVACMFMLLTLLILAVVPYTKESPGWVDRDRNLTRIAKIYIKMREILTNALFVSYSQSNACRNSTVLRFQSMDATSDNCQSKTIYNYLLLKSLPQSMICVYKEKDRIFGTKWHRMQKMLVDKRRKSKGLKGVYISLRGNSSELRIMWYQTVLPANQHLCPLNRPCQNPRQAGRYLIWCVTDMWTDTSCYGTSERHKDTQRKTDRQTDSDMHTHTDTVTCRLSRSVRSVV